MCETGADERAITEPLRICQHKADTLSSMKSRVLWLSAVVVCPIGCGARSELDTTRPNIGAMPATGGTPGSAGPASGGFYAVGGTSGSIGGSYTFTGGAAATGGAESVVSPITVSYSHSCALVGD